MIEEEHTAPVVDAAEAADGPQPEDEAPTATSGDSPMRIADLEQRIAELEGQLARERDAATDYMNRWQRAQADFSNYRRRAQQEQEQVQRALAAEAARIVLPALDSFERAFATLPDSLRGYTWISGVALVEMQLRGVLTAAGIRAVAVEPGYAFDPAKHEAIGEVETAQQPEGHVAVVVQAGYEVEGGPLLRPALVQLVRAPKPTTVVASADAGGPAETTDAATTTNTTDTADSTTTEAETATPDAPAS